MSGFEEMSGSLYKAINYYEIVLVDHLNINVSCSKNDVSNHLKDLTDLFYLGNLISSATCSKGPSRTALDVILINKPKCFFITQGFS